MGMEQVKRGFNNCFECKQTIGTQSYLTCCFCKKGIHEKCVRELNDDKEADKVVAQKDRYNCQSCLEEENPKTIENVTGVKIAQLSIEVENLLSGQDSSISVDTEPVIDEVNETEEPVLEELREEVPIEEIEEVELEELTMTTEDSPAEKVEDVETIQDDDHPKQNSKPCCIWEQCKNCEELKKEKDAGENELRSALQEIANLNDKLKSVEEEHINYVATKESEDNEANTALKDLKEKTVKLEEDLKLKRIELESNKKIYEKDITDIKATLDNSDDVNLMRLRKAHSELKKEFTKATETHKKE